MTQAAKDVVAAAFGIAMGAVPDDAAVEAFEPWDSLGHVQVLAALEKKLGRSLTLEETLSIKDLASLTALLERPR